MTIGPPLDDGFYYDMYTGGEACGGEGRTASEVDFKAIETALSTQISKKGQGMYNRIEVTKEQALEMFGYNKFKVEMIHELMDAGTKFHTSKPASTRDNKSNAACLWLRHNDNCVPGG
eukprot:SAG31_NODE_515_length_14710_cov_6.289097_3_plen_118_part_00